MIVLHILMGILKGIGIFLLVLLGLILAVLFAVLFCPVGYRASLRKDADSYGVEAGISWFFHLLSVRIGYESQVGEPQYSVRLFGIPLEKVMKFFEGRKKKQKTSEASEDTQETEAETPSVEERKPAETEETEEETILEVPEEPPQETKEQKKTSVFLKIKEVFEKIGAWIKKILQIPEKIRKGLKNFGLTLRKMCDKIEEVRNFLESEHFINAKTLVFGEVARVFKYIAPRKLKGTLKFGMEDPFLTGELLAAAGIFYPLYGEHLTIEPYFDQKILEGDLYFSGKIRGSFFVALAWRVFRNPDVRYVIKKLK